MSGLRANESILTGRAARTMECWSTGVLGFKSITPSLHYSNTPSLQGGRHMPKHLPIIDADAHVLETEHTWDYLEPSERKFRPQLFYSPDDETRQYWVIDDKIRGFRARTLSEQELTKFSQQVGRNVETPQAARELDDVELRLKHMDELGIDIQVLHNTFWIEQI